MLSTTELVADIGSHDATINYIEGVALNGSLYFSGTSKHSTIGIELYRWDPDSDLPSETVTSGDVTLIADINPGSSSSTPHNLTVLNGKLYFHATDQLNDTEIWRFDPVENTLKRITDSVVWEHWSTPPPRELLAWNDRLYFTNYSEAAGLSYRVEIFEYDPIASQGLGESQRIAITYSTPTYPAHLFGMGNQIYFQSRGTGSISSYGNALVAYTPASTVGDGRIQRVAQIQPTTGSDGFRSSVEYSGGLFFMTVEQDVGRTIWQLNFEMDVNGEYVGVPEQIYQDSAPVYQAYDMEILDGKLYFLGKQEDTGLELYEFDFDAIDEEPIVSLVADFNVGPADSDVQDLKVIKDRLFIKVDDVVWQYDPKSDSPLIQKLFANENVPRESFIRDPSTFTLLDDQIFFSVSTKYAYPTYPTMWTIKLANDGMLTPANQVSDTSRTASSDPTFLTLFQGNLYYFANSSLNSGRNLWRHDIATGSDHLVANLQLEQYDSPSAMVVSSGKLYFQISKDHGSSDNEYSLWRFDPNELNGPPHRLLTLPESVKGMVSVQGQLYLNVERGNMFRFEPQTESEDAHLVTISENLAYHPGLELNGHLYYTDSHNRALRYDPVSGLTYPLIQNNGKNQWSSIYGIYVAGDRVFLSVDRYGSHDIWQYDPATDTSQRIISFPHGNDENWFSHDFTEANGIFYFRARNENRVEELWQWAPDANQGFGQVKRLTDIRSELAPSDGYVVSRDIGIAVVGNRIYFASESVEHSWQIWSYDTLTEKSKRETFFARENLSTQNPTIPAELIAVDGKVFFVSTDHQFGREIFVIDPLADFAPTISSRLFLRDESTHTAGDVTEEHANSPQVFGDQEAPFAELWITLNEAPPSNGFQLTFVVENSVPWLSTPQIIDALGIPAVEVFVSEVSPNKVKITLVGVDLSEYEIGDQILAAKLKYGFTQGHDTGELFSGKNGVIQLTSADVDFSTTPMMIEEDGPVQFIAPAYDANGDGKVGLQDFALFISNYGKQTGPDFPQTYHFDYDRDGRIGLRDFARFIRNYGKTAETFSANMARIESPSGEELMSEGEPIELYNDTYANSKGLDALGISYNVPTISTASNSAMGSVEDIATPKTIPTKETPLLQSGDFIASVEQIFSQGFLLDTSTTAETQFELDCALEIITAHPSSMILPKP